MKHSSRVLDYSLKFTVLATVLTAAAPLAATFVDGLISGNLIGKSAFNAVNIVLPVSNLMMVLTLICNMGGSVLAAKALGEGNRQLARKIFTISFLSALLVAVLGVLIIISSSDRLYSLLCPDPEDLPYVKKYLGILVFYFLLFPFTTTLNNFISVEGYPGLTTKAVVVANVANIILDVIFIVILHWGIEGVAWATVASGIINILMYIPFFLKGKSQYGFERIGREDMHLCKSIFAQGFGFNVFYIMTNLLAMFSNRLVLGNFGSDGMTMYGVCLQIQSFTFCVALGLAIAGISQITALMSEGDNESIRLVMKKLISGSALVYAIILLLMTFFSEFIASMFGIHDQAILDQCRYPFFCFSVYYLCFGIISVYTTICFQLMGYVWAKACLVFGLGICVYLSMLVLSFFEPSLMWLGFPVGGLSILAATFAFGYSKYRKDRSLTKFTLVSRFPNDVRINLTISSDGKDIPQMLECLRSFSGICEISERNRHNIELCCCELCDSVKELDLPLMADCFDLTFRQDSDKFIMNVKVPGAPYCLKIDEETLRKYHEDPENLSVEEIKEIILNELPESLSYRYMFSLNVTTLIWKI